MANSANMLQLCRLCLVKEQVNIPIFEEQGDIRRIFQKISSCLPVKVSRDDKLPKKICDGCSYKLDICYEFWNTSANSEKQLLTWLGDLGVKNDNKISDSSKTSSSHSTNKHHQTDAPVVKKEEIDLSDAQDKDDDEDDENKAYMFQQKLEESNSSSGGPSATVTTNNEDESPPPKRQRRTAAVKAAIAMDHDSDDDDDSGEPLTKIEDETDDSDGDDNDPSFVDVPSTSADDQPGPSGVGKDNSDAPIHNSDLEEIYITVVKADDEIIEDGVSYYFSNDDDETNMDVPNETINSQPSGLKFETSPFEKIYINVQRDTLNNDEQSDKCHRMKTLCAICGQMIDNRGMHYHMRGHSITNSNNKQKVDINSQFQCNKCLFICENAFEYATHNSKIHNKSSYPCPLCKFSSHCKNSLFNHIKRHEGRFNYTCEICGKGFLGKALLESHQEIHLDIKRYSCDLCNKKFSVKRYLYVHRQLNHKKELYGIEQLHKCHVCNREFTFEKSLKRHQSAIHHIGEDRTVQCPVCYKTIANSYNLKGHMRTHTGEKNYCCDVCGKAFSAYKYWKKHKAVHEKERETSENTFDNIDADNMKMDSFELMTAYDNFEDTFQI